MCNNLANSLRKLEVIRRNLDHLRDATDHNTSGIDALISSLDDQIKNKKTEVEKCLDKKDIKPVPINIAVSSIECWNETGGEIGDDSPYVLVFAIDLATAIPAPVATLVGPWTGVTDGEHHGTINPIPNLPDSLTGQVVKRPFWSTTGAAKLIAKPNDVIFLIMMVEHDNSDLPGLRVLLEALLTSKVPAIRSEDRAHAVAALIKTLNDGFGKARQDFTFPPNFDDQIGPARELRLSTLDLKLAAFRKHHMSLDFRGDGGSYTVNFELTTPK